MERENVTGSCNGGRKAVRFQNHKSKGQEPNSRPSQIEMGPMEELGRRKGTSRLLQGGGSCQRAGLSTRR